MAKPVSLEAVNQSYEIIFKQISKQTGVVFSYGSFDSRQKTTYSCSKKSLDKVLDELLEYTCSYKVRDKYIILNNCKSERPPAKKNMTISGSVFDFSSGKKLLDASVFVKTNKHSVLTDRNGEFVLHVPEKSGIVLTIAKIGYSDTSLWVENGVGGLKIGMKPLLKVQQAEELAIDKDTTLRHRDSLVEARKTSKLDSLLDSWEEEGRRIWHRLRARNPNFRNITDTLFSRVSLSFIPPISTNRLLSLNTVNNFSFNILAGHSKGVQGFELAGLLNVDAGDVRYAQIAGLANIVRGNVEGFQLGGIANVNGGATEGIQVAGISNFNRGNSFGAQIAGIANINRGFVDGFQLAGISNICSQSAYGFQLAGISNQAFGVMGGTQLSGIYNSADTMYGFQLAGIVNRAREMYGVQLGLINIAGQHYGIPIGLFSFVRKGYHKAELAYDDIGFGTVAFRTGVDRFHNIVFGGVNSRDRQTWTLGYGLGSSFKCSKKWYFNMDLTAQTVQQSTTSWEELQALGKFYTGLEYRPFKKLNFFAGMTFNAFVSDENSAWKPVSYISKNYAYSHSFSQVNLDTWVGVKFGVRFL